jgi:IS5 family transposase
MPNTKKTRSHRKELYRVRNWSEYDRALVKRGSITVWISDDFEEAWFYQGPSQRGSQFDYSAQAIEIMLTVKNVFHLPNRATEGFLRSLFEWLQIELSVPDHTTLSRRGKKLAVRLPKQAKGALDIVMDSTGLKIYGEGEWKVRTHGKSKRRTWRKLHLCIDRKSGEIEAAELTEAGISDDAMVEPMLTQIEQPINSLSADGIYDKRRVYKSIHKHAPAAKVLIPPRKNARIWQHGNSKAERLKRDENLRYIRQHGRAAWKDNSGYHGRSLAETGMFRFKTIFGDQLSARLIETQTTQALIRCAALNKMTHLGMPQSYKVTA